MKLPQASSADQFPVDALQGGAGTSTNMNLNEVIANRAIEILGGNKGDYSLIHPLEDVNLHQSTNDVYPTAIKVAGIYRLRDLAKAIADLQGAFQEKEKEFGEIVKIGTNGIAGSCSHYPGRGIFRFCRSIFARPLADFQMRGTSARSESGRNSRWYRTCRTARLYFSGH